MKNKKTIKKLGHILAGTLIVATLAPQKQSEAGVYDVDSKDRCITSNFRTGNDGHVKKIQILLHLANNFESCLGAENRVIQRQFRHARRIYPLRKKWAQIQSLRARIGSSRRGIGAAPQHKPAVRRRGSSAALGGSACHGRSGSRHWPLAATDEGSTRTASP